MESYLKNLSKKLASFSLTERERTAIRLELAAFIAEHPAQVPLRMRVLQYISVWGDALGSRQTSFGIRTVSMAFMLVLVVGAGTSYAARSALPGQALYALKINVTEPVERILTASSQSQAQWDVTLANKRLGEAEKLAVAGMLTTSNAHIVETQLDAVTENFNATVTTLASSTGDVVQASNAQSDLEASLSAHVQVLAAIASSSPSVDAAVAPILASVRTHAATAHTARVASLKTFDESVASSSIRVAASGEMQNAESQLTGVRALISTISSGGANASTTAQIDTDASDTQGAINLGDSNANRGHFKAAFKAFQAAARAAKEAQVGAQAQSNLGNSIILPPIIPSEDATSTDAADAPDSAKDPNASGGAIQKDIQNMQNDLHGALGK